MILTWLISTQQLEDHYSKWYRQGVSFHRSSQPGDLREQGLFPNPADQGYGSHKYLLLSGPRWFLRTSKPVGDSVIMKDLLCKALYCVQKWQGYLFFFLRNLQFRWRQQTKCNEVYKCCETEAHKGLGHEMEGGLSHCKAWAKDWQWV